MIRFSAAKIRSVSFFIGEELVIPKRASLIGVVFEKRKDNKKIEKTIKTIKIIPFFIIIIARKKQLR